MNNKIPVLVAIMNDIMAWEIAKKYHWYRIPVKSEKLLRNKITDFKHIAFYQTKIFGDEKWAINYCAKITGVETAKRIDLLPYEKNHPRAKENYYKMNIGRVLKMKKSIPSRNWRRIVFISTTLKKMKNAEEINDLYDDSPLEDAMWGNLRRSRINAERQVFIKKGRIKYCLDFAIFCRKGNIDIECDGEKWHSKDEIRIKDRDRNNRLTSSGWHVLRFGTDDIFNDTGKCMSIIKDTIKELSGVSEEKAKHYN